MGLYDMGLKWHLVIYFQLNIRAATLIQVFHGRPFPTKMVSQFLYDARKGRAGGKGGEGTRGGADDEHKSAVKSQEKMCEVNYDNDHKDNDIQLKATKEGVLFSRPHNSQHVPMIIRKHSEMPLVPLGAKGIKRCGSKILIT